VDKPGGITNIWSQLR